MFKKGQINNPHGRPKAPEVEELRIALKAAKEKNNKSLIDHFVERAYSNDKVLVAVMKKLIPDITLSELTGPDGKPLIPPVVKYLGIAPKEGVHE